MVDIKYFFLKWREQAIKAIAVAATIALAGCTTTGPEAAGIKTSQKELLQPWINLTGARAGAPTALPGIVGGTGYVVLRQPAAISARNNDLYLLDTGLRRIFRYSRIEQTLTPFTGMTAEAGMNIYVAADMSVYITDPARVRVLHFSGNGTPLPSLNSPGDLGRPVSIAADEGSGEILVADALYDQIVRFNNLGRPLSIIKPQQVRGIAAIALGSDGIYVLDRIARQVVVIGRDGSYRYAFGAGTLASPQAIAVDRGNMVFVSDQFDQTVKIYRGRQLVGSVGGSGAAPGCFNDIAGLTVDGGLLYIADSLNANVQIMFINPQALSNRKGE